MPKSISVLQIISSPSAGGAETFVRDLVISANLHKYFRIAILFISDSEEIGRCDLFQDNFLRLLKTHKIEFFFLSKGSRRNPFKGMVQFKEVIRFFKPDIIHCHLQSAALYALMFAHNTPLLFTQHSIVRKNKGFIFKFILSKCQKVIAISESCSSSLKPFVPKGTKMEIIENGVDRNRLIPRKNKGHSEHVRFIAVGSLSEPKNYTLMFDAFALVKGKCDFNLRVVGEGNTSYTKKLKNYVEFKGLSERVEFLGNRADVNVLLNNSDVFIMSSAWEGLPIALLEAQITGLPAIVTNVGSCKEVLLDTMGGLVVNKGNASELAKAIETLLDNTQLRNDYSLNSLNNSSKYTIEFSVAKHLKVYQEQVIGFIK